MLHLGLLIFSLVDSLLKKFMLNNPLLDDLSFDDLSSNCFSILKTDSDVFLFND
jgi:hypothetical protein